MPGAARLTVRGVRTGSAAENGTSHRSAAGFEAVSLRRNRSRSSAPRLPVSVVRSRRPGAPHAAETSTTEPSPAVAVPPGSAEQAFATSAPARSPAGARFANCGRSGPATVSPPFAAVSRTRGLSAPPCDKNGLK